MGGVVTAGDELYAWQSEDTSRSWSLIMAVVPALGIGQRAVLLIGRQHEAVVELFGPIAQAHGERFGQRVRLVRFTLAEQLEVH
jgi:hypothetical protein